MLRLFVAMAVMAVAALSHTAIAEGPTNFGRSKATPADYKVHSLPRVTPKEELDFDLFSGYMPSPDVHALAHYFFWFAPCPIKDAPLVIWLQGGPGCTSQFGFFRENGPLQLQPDGGLGHNPHSWTKTANMLWLDQPVGTGFSYSDDPDHYSKDEKDLSKDFVSVLEHFYDVWPAFRTRPLYIFGESYGGYYVSSISYYVHMQNLKGNTKINLVGAGLGNGAVDDWTQTKAYIDYAYYHGLVDLKTKFDLTDRWKTCDARSMRIANSQGIEAVDGCMLEQDMLAAALGPNEYDIRVWGIYDFFANSPIEKYFNQKDVQEAAHMIPSDTTPKAWQHHHPKEPWYTCSPTVGKQMLHDKPIDESRNIAVLLNAGIQLLFYNGLMDISCNFLGTQVSFLFLFLLF